MLQLTRLKLSKNTLTPKWLSLDMKRILELLIVNSEINSIQGYAFADDLFQSLKELSLVDLPLTTLSNDAFYGLKSLEFLVFQSTSIHQLSSDHLIKCQSLKEINVYENDHNKLDVSELTYNIALLQLKVIVFNKNYLKSAITRKTFSGQISPTKIDLRSNEIESIEDNAFDNVLKTLKYLVLADNKLKRLPDGLFDWFYADVVKVIQLGNNPWTCNCANEDLRFHLQNFPGKFPDMSRIRCTSIDYSESQEIVELPYLCNSTDPSKMTIGIHLNCSDVNITKFINIQLKKRKIPYIYTENAYRNEYTLTLAELRSDQILIGFEMNESNANAANWERSHCFKNPRNFSTIENVKIRLKLDSERIYQYCVVKKSFSAISSFDCVLFYSELKIWISMNNRATVIILIVIASIKAFVFGLVLSFFIFNRFPNAVCLKIKKKDEKSTKVFFKCPDTVFIINDEPIYEEILPPHLRPKTETNK